MAPPGESSDASRRSAALDPVLTPHGRLILEERADAADLDPAAASRLSQAFAGGTGGGLLQLGAGEVQTALPPTFAYWRDFAARYVNAPCAQPEEAGAPGGASNPAALPCPDDGDLEAVAAAVPPRRGPSRTRCGRSTPPGTPSAACTST